MSSLSTKRWLAAAAGLSWLSCGGVGAEGILDPTGGEVCLPDRRVCISVVLGGIGATQGVRIQPSTQAPAAAALSDTWDIIGSGGEAVTFLQPARVSFSLAYVDAGSVPSENLLRIYTVEEGAWVALGSPRVDRVRDEVVGETTHLSPFVVLRADRLPDGGLPIEIDGGPRDSGVVVVIPFDGGFGRPDAGRPDAGPPDAGRPDAGRPDAGPADAGPADAGPADAGPADAGPADAGPADAGPADAGPADAGPADAGPADAGPADAGEADAGEFDAGVLEDGGG